MATYTNNDCMRYNSLVRRATFRQSDICQNGNGSHLKQQQAKHTHTHQRQHFCIPIKVHRYSNLLLSASRTIQFVRNDVDPCHSGSLIVSDGAFFHLACVSTRVHGRDTTELCTAAGASATGISTSTTSGAKSSTHSRRI